LSQRAVPLFSWISKGIPQNEHVDDGRNTVAKKRAGQKDVDADYLFADSSSSRPN